MNCSASSDELIDIKLDPVSIDDNIQTEDPSSVNDNN